MLFGLPLSVLLLAIAWGLLQVIFVRTPPAMGRRTMFHEEYRKLGPTSYEEKMVLALSATLAILWLLRQDIALGSMTIPGWSGWLQAPGYIDDGTVAIAVAMLFFLIPARSKASRLMNWENATKLNWGIVILFGGGFALAAGFKESGLSAWIAESLTALHGIDPVFQVGGTCLTITFLTELTSNTATTQIVLPLLGSLASAINVNPLLLMIPATISASCAFMLPVATPPNAIVFGTGEVTMGIWSGPESS